MDIHRYVDVTDQRQHRSTACVDAEGDYFNRGSWRNLPICVIVAQLALLIPSCLQHSVVSTNSVSISNLILINNRYTKILYVVLTAYSHYARQCAYAFKIRTSSYRKYQSVASFYALSCSHEKFLRD